MANLSSFYPQPVVAGTTEGTFAEGNHTHELDELEATSIPVGKVLTATGSNTASWENPTGEVEEAPEDGVIYGRKDADWVDITEPANLQVRRGTAAEVAAITPLEGEPVWATDTKLLFLGDGSTQGGVQVGNFPIAGTRPVGTAAAAMGRIFAADSMNQVGGSLVLGNARGAGAVDLQTRRSSASQVASALHSIILGGFNNASSSVHSIVLNGSSNSAGGGGYSIVGGLRASVITNEGSPVSTVHATAIGRDVQASGVYSLAYGFNSIASKDYSVAFSGVADKLNMLAFGGAGVDDLDENFLQTTRAQSVLILLKAITTNATPKTMASSSFLVGSENIIKIYPTITNNTILFGTVQICAVEKNTATEAAHYIRKFAIQNVGGSTSIVGSITTIGTDYESNSGYNVSITADDTDDYLKIDVTGNSSKTLRWVAAIHGVEIGI